MYWGRSENRHLVQTSPINPLNETHLIKAVVPLSLQHICTHLRQTACVSV